MPTDLDSTAASPEVTAADDETTADAHDNGLESSGDQRRAAGTGRRTTSLVGALAFVALPVVIIGLGGMAGWLKWVDGSSREARSAAGESVQAARDTTVALLSYQPGSVKESLEAAQSRLTGSFRDSYGQLIQEVVIPGAEAQKISAVANVAAAASVSASSRHAVALLFVNQTSTIGAGAPTDTASTVRVSLEKVDGRWLVSEFTPI
ncbi:hypothetical protein C6A86_007615 [Mycobacterium sp. ITM-2016-00316]|uniref:hypothetical protein n=1 Tax=Mycobacterium sp. ITM-2016-00316 TaxID=2099695 RepID=UPI000CF91626|nr:hypothetical protein [Mycobacterium sp. ITM-2016-00316]WNG83516.1 hypothetical protein C6A86_007615 [Mycobacterium sp. ITM-2016-00316]